MGMGRWNQDSTMGCLRGVGGWVDGGRMALSAEPSIRGAIYTAAGYLALLNQTYRLV